MDRTINDIITTGREMNQKMTKKIEDLNKGNNAFYNALSKRLTDILNSNDNFKDTNLKGLNYAIDEFLVNNPAWSIKFKYPFSSGLTILEKS